MRTGTFKTISGIELEIRHVSGMTIERVISEAKADFEAEHGQIKKPTYTTSVGEVFEHDKDSIADETTSDAEKAAWLEYLNKSNELQRITLDEVSDQLLLLGVVSFPESDEWKERHKLAGAQIPVDERPLKLFWLDEEILSSRAERLKLAQAIKAMGDPVEVETAKTVDMFPHTVEKP